MFVPCKNTTGSPSYVTQVPSFQSVPNKLFWPPSPWGGNQLNTLNIFFIMEESHRAGIGKGFKVVDSKEKIFNYLNRREDLISTRTLKHFHCYFYSKFGECD